MAQMSPIMLATFIGARLILVLLVGLSIWSVAIMVDRKKYFDAFDREGSGGWLEQALTLLRGSKNQELKALLGSEEGIRATTLKLALDIPPSESDRIEKIVKSYLSSQRVSMERGLTVLATLGSNAPFIGLLGTVLGIINAFGALAESQNNTNAVMAGISEALVATAVGLFVAIPAVIAYNIFARKMRLVLSDCESLRDLYLSQPKGH